MKERLTILLMSLFAAVLTCTATVPPYIIILGEDESVPELSDDYIQKNGLSIRFQPNSSHVRRDDPGYRKLRQALLTLPAKYRYCRLLILRGSASPDGPAANNKWMAHRRARALSDTIRHYLTLPDSAVEERYVDEDFSGLRDIVSASNIKYKDRILAELDRPISNELKKRHLMDLDDGRAWHLLGREVFPKLRATRVVILVSEGQSTRVKDRVAAEEKDIVTEEQKPTDGVKDIVTEEQKPTDNRQQLSVRDTVTPTPLPREGSGEASPGLLAIKTNLLYDLALTPNIEIERWLGRNHRWSIMAEWNFPWWEWHNKERVYEVNEFGLELRRWLSGSQPRLTGHFIGLYIAGGYYDLEWDYKGEQGDIYSAGLSYGYSLRLARHWNMEFSLAAGYLHSPYTHYEARDRNDDLYPQYKKKLNYFGPTKLKIAFVWFLGK